ncbi:MAG: DUF4129 domain-containing protein [Caldiserica bacterium]|jgi:hypothetical protein|nr:DUF4129 domain-containing protein [Caldisericota bacterium]MDH7562316.1 DUF4129 domain-containing protein [Caldisericota bacterium]
MSPWKRLLEMEVPAPSRFLHFKFKFPYRRSLSGVGVSIGREALGKSRLLVLGLIFLHYLLLSLFIGQLTPFPLFWGLLILFSISLGLSFFQFKKDKNLHGWLWGFILSIFLLKFLFFPSFVIFEESWLRDVGNGFKDLFGLGWGIFNSLKVGELVSSTPSSAGALFLLMAFLLWLPTGISLDRALRYSSGGWLLAVSLLVIAWLEPTRTFPFFFPLFVILLFSLYLILWQKSRNERWRNLRFRHQKWDKRRVFLISLFALVPLLVFLLPWAFGNLVHFSNFLPQVPSIQVESPPPSLSPQTPPGSSPFSSLYLPPLTLPSWVETLGGYSSYVAILLFFMIGAFLYFRLGKGQSLVYLVVAITMMVLALWLLPPYLGPILTKAFYYLKVGFNSFLAALGISRGTGPSGQPAGPGGQINPESPNSILEFFRSLISFFSQASVVLISLAVILLGIALFLLARSGWNPSKIWGVREKGGKTPISSGNDLSSPLSFYFRLLKELEGRGIKRRDTETPWEFEERARGVLPLFKEELGHLTSYFVRARYGKIFPSPEETEFLENQLEGLREKVKEVNGNQKD